MFPQRKGFVFRNGKVMKGESDNKSSHIFSGLFTTFFFFYFWRRIIWSKLIRPKDILSTDDWLFDVTRDLYYKTFYGRNFCRIVIS
jgi:hypothetical protein